MKKKKKKPEVPAESGTGKVNAPRAMTRLGILFLNFVLFYALFRVMIELSERTQNIAIYYATVIVYALATGGVFIAFFILNGFTFDAKPRTREDLPDSWDDVQKNEFLLRQPSRREQAKKLIYILMPLVVVLLLSFIELNFLG